MTEKVIVRLSIHGPVTDEIHVPETLEMSDNDTISDVLDAADIFPDQIVVRSGGRTVPLSTTVGHGMDLDIIVISSAG